MTALKIAGIVAVATWMAFTSWRLEYAIHTAEAACSVAEASSLNFKPRTFKSGIPCPKVVFAYPDEVKPRQ
jgi:hypothetical protein